MVAIDPLVASLGGNVGAPGTFGMVLGMVTSGTTTVPVNGLLPVLSKDSRVISAADALSLPLPVVASASPPAIATNNTIATVAARWFLRFSLAPPFVTPPFVTPPFVIPPAPPPAGLPGRLVCVALGSSGRIVVSSGSRCSSVTSPLPRHPPSPGRVSPNRSAEPERLQRLEASGLERGRKPGEDRHADRQPDPQGHAPVVDDDHPAGDRRDEIDDPDAERRAYEPTEDAHEQGFEQELHGDHRPGVAERAANADLG